MEILLDLQNIKRLMQGILITFKISFISIIFSCIFGFIFGYLMNTNNFIIRFLCNFYLEAIRIIPVLAWLFIVYFGLSSFISFNAVGACIFVFSLWGIAEMGDLVRGAISSLPKHQIESARALGLGEIKIQIFILFPQALKRLLPSLVNLFTRMIKTTSLAALIGVSDLLKVGQQIIENNILEEPLASFWVYGGVFLAYFFLCYPLSLLSSKLEKRL
ncbi:amino acid ABC transporter permease [Helicobacter burdigaliensis]|uniref:amino acid ABC transporter permease n=1 Tax=Helicobacter burdigaliensis TaxID=2315334 RepID=UPI000EF7186A|nr:amino acid ABC transporter permease [Helicobacter burdigaliensis]